MAMVTSLRIECVGAEAHTRKATPTVALQGLWVQAQRTRNDFLARVGITPLVQEARGLDAGPRLVHRLKSLRDHVRLTLLLFGRCSYA